MTRLKKRRRLLRMLQLAEADDGAAFLKFFNKAKNGEGGSNAQRAMAAAKPHWRQRLRWVLTPERRDVLQRAGL